MSLITDQKKGKTLSTYIKTVIKSTFTICMEDIEAFEMSNVLPETVFDWGSGHDEMQFLTVTTKTACSKV